MKYELPTLERAQKLHEQGQSWEDVASQVGATSGNAIRKAVSRHEDKLGDTLTTHNDHSSEIEDALKELFPDNKVPADLDWREVLDLCDNINELHKRIDPDQEYLTVDLSDWSEPVAIVSSSDWHFGGGYTDHESIRKTAEFVLNNDNFKFGLTGDILEGFIPGVKPAETTEQMAVGNKIQLAFLRSFVSEAVANRKLLWMTHGDHDAKWWEQQVGVNVPKQQIHDKVPYFNSRGLVTVQLGDQEYYIMVNHSERFASQWNPNHPQRRQRERFFPADAHIAGHKHKPAFQMIYHYSELRRAGFNLGGKAWLIANGTFKSGPDPYTCRSWNRGVIGCPTLVLQPDRHEIDVFESPIKAKTFMEGIK